MMSTKGLSPFRRPNFKLTGSHCHYCGVELCMSIGGGSGYRKPTNLLTVDHKTATARGGEDKAPNLALCCLQCNTRKGDRPAEDYRPNSQTPVPTLI